MSGLPIYVTIGEVAQLLGWTRWRTSRWLQRADALVERGGRKVVTLASLRDAFPEVFERYLTELGDRDEDEGDDDD